MRFEAVSEGDDVRVTDTMTGESMVITVTISPQGKDFPYTLYLTLAFREPDPVAIPYVIAFTGQADP